MKIALGSAQFGLQYGVSNAFVQVPKKQVQNILDECRRLRVTSIDTAIVYGNCEQLLGMIGVSDFNVVTKLPRYNDPTLAPLAWVEQHVEDSLNRLKLKSLEGIMFHDVGTLKGPEGERLVKAVVKLKERGLINKIGVSIYNPEEINCIFETFSPDIIQAPLNVLDRRIVSSGWLEELRQKDVEVHVRSIFLQGLLLMRREKIPVQFEKWSDLWNDWHSLLEKEKLNPVFVCLNFIKSLTGIDRIIVGVNSCEQITEIVKEWNAAAIKLDTARFSTEDDALINPSKWDNL